MIDCESRPPIGSDFRRYHMVHPDFPYQTTKINCELINRYLLFENRNHILLFWRLFVENCLTVTIITIQKDKLEFSLRIPPEYRNEVLLLPRSLKISPGSRSGIGDNFQVSTNSKSFILN